MSIEKPKKNKLGKVKKFLNDINSSVIAITAAFILFLLILIGGTLMYYDRIEYTYKHIDRLDENLDRMQKNIALLTAIHVSNTNMDKFDKEYNRNLEKTMCKIQKIGNYFNNIEQHCWKGFEGLQEPIGTITYPYTLKEGRDGLNPKDNIDGFHGNSINGKFEDGPRGPRGPITTNDPQYDNVLYVDDNTVINEKKEEPRKPFEFDKETKEELLKILTKYKLER